MEYCSRCKYQDKREHEAPCAGCIHNAVENFKPMSQGDKIRSMTDEELADFIEMKQFFAIARNGTDGEDYTLKWLKSEVGCE